MTRQYKLVLQDRDTNKTITFDSVLLTNDNAIAIEKRLDYLGMKVLEIKCNYHIKK